MTRPGIEPRSPGALANTLTARPMSGLVVVVVVVVVVENFSNSNYIAEISSNG